VISSHHEFWSHDKPVPPAVIAAIQPFVARTSGLKNDRMQLTGDCHERT
jgi:hypothetical protein